MKKSKKIVHAYFYIILQTNTGVKPKVIGDLGYCHCHKSTSWQGSVADQRERRIPPWKKKSEKMLFSRNQQLGKLLNHVFPTPSNDAPDPNIIKLFEVRSGSESLPPLCFAVLINKSPNLLPRRSGIAVWKHFLGIGRAEERIDSKKDKFQLH